MCINCGVYMGKYFCDACKLFDDDVSRRTLSLRLLLVFHSPASNYLFIFLLSDIKAAISL